MYCSSEQRSRAPDCRCRDFAVNVAIFTNLRRDFFFAVLPWFSIVPKRVSCDGLQLRFDSQFDRARPFDLRYGLPGCQLLYIAAWIQQAVQWTVLRSEVREKKVTNHQHQPISQTDARTQGGAYLVTFDKQVSK